MPKCLVPLECWGGGLGETGQGLVGVLWLPPEFWQWFLLCKASHF